MVNRSSRQLALALYHAGGGGGRRHTGDAVLPVLPAYADHGISEQSGNDILHRETAMASRQYETTVAS